MYTPGICKKQSVLLALLFLWQSVSSAETVTVSINTQPEGALVCEKLFKKVDCFGRAPFKKDMVLQNVNASKKLVLSAVGYKPKGIVFDVTKTSFNEKLEKVNIFDDSLTTTPNIDKRIRGVLDGLVYGGEIGRLDFEMDFFGKIRYLVENNKKVLYIPLIINNRAVNRKIQLLRNTRDHVARQNKTIDILMDNGVGEYISIFMQKLKNMDIDYYQFDVSYSKTRTELGWETIHVYIHELESVRIKQVGGSLVQEETYRSGFVPRRITTLKDKTVLGGYSFIIENSKSNQIKQEKEGLKVVFENSDIFTDDTWDNQTVKVDYKK